MGNSTQGATHVTKLSIDVSELQKNVSVAQSLIDNLANNAVAQAERIKQSLNDMSKIASNNATAGASGVSSAGTQQQFNNQTIAINATTKALKSLEGQYLTIQKAILNTKSLQKGAFSNADKEVTNAIRTLKDYQAILERGGTLTKEQEKRLSELGLQAKTLANEIKRLNNESQKTQQGASGQSPIEKSMRATREEVEKTSKAYNEFILKLGKSPLSESYTPFKTLFSGVKDSERQVESLLQAITRTGTATDDQKAKLIALTSQLKSFQTEYAKILRTATDKNVGFKSDIATATIKDIEKISITYQKLLQNVNKLRFNDTEFKNASAAIRDNAAQLTVWIQTLQSAGSIPSDVANKLAGMREQVSGLTEVVTRFTTSKKSIQEFSKELQVAQKFLKEVQNQTTLSKDSNPYKQVLSGAEQYEKKLKSLLNAVVANNGATKDQANALETLTNHLNRLKEGYARVVELANKTGKGLAPGSFKIDTSAFEKAILSIQRFQQMVSGSNLKNSDAFRGLLFSAENAQKRVEQLYDSFRKGNISATQAKEVLKEVESTMTGLQTSFSKFTTEQNKSSRSFENVNKQIRATVSELKNLEKATVYGAAKQDITALKNDYQKLYDSIKSGTISVSEAQNQLQALGTRYQELSSHIQTGSTALQRFTDKIAESVKWRVAQSMITMLYSSFTELISTIKDTEDAVIGLQRVINDPMVSASGMQSALHDIAFEYGRTFEEAAQTATRFAQTGLDWTDTLEATKASMLGLNVTELSLSTATDGLIAVMSQFGIQASDLDDVINKVNITSDNFPVTAEKIVSALQRTGASAAAAGMTLEETIAVITALSEATGRSGENLGTALNSIIAFTSKDTALKTFSDYLQVSVETLRDETPIQVWKRLGDAIKGDEDAIADMMAQSQEFSELFTADIANALNLQNEYNQAVANEQDVYSQAGTYRKTYFISLLNNIDTAIAALDKMRNAEGYSIAENKKTTESLAAKWNQLGTAVHDLAVSFGEAGFLDFLKFLADAATDTVKLIGSLGGLTTVLGVIIMLFIKVKAQKLEQMFFQIVDAVSIFVSGLKAGATASEAYALALNSVKISMGGIVGIASLVALGVYSVVQYFKQATEASKQLREENVKLAQDATTSAKDLASAYKEYQNALAGDSDRAEAVERLLEVLGYEREDISYLVEEYGELEDGTHSLEQALDVLAQKKYEQLQLDAKLFSENVTPEALGFSAIEQVSVAYDKMSESEQKAADVLEDFQLVSVKIKDSLKDNLFGDNFFGLETNFTLPEKLDEAREKLEQAKAALEKMDETMTSSDNKTSTLRQGLEAYIVTLGKYIQALADGEHGQEEMSQSFQDFMDNFSESSNKADDYIDTLNDIADANENAKKRVEDLDKAIEATQKAFDEVSGIIDSFQSAYGSIVGVIEEYNETGYITADMVQTLLSLEPKYLEMLEVKNGKIGLNKDAVNKLVAANDIYMVQLTALKIQEYAEAKAKELQAAEAENLTIAQLEAAGAADFLAGGVAIAAAAFLTGQDDGTKLTEALYGLAGEFGLTADRADYMTGKVWDQTKSMDALHKQMGKTYSTDIKINTIYTTEYRVKGNPSFDPKVDLKGTSGSEFTVTKTYNDAGPYSASSQSLHYAEGPENDDVETYSAESIQYGITDVVSNNPDINFYYPSSKSSSSSKKSTSSTSSSNKSSSSSTKNTTSTTNKSTTNKSTTNTSTTNKSTTSKSTPTTSSSTKSSDSSDSSESSGKSPEEEAAENAKKAYDELIDTYEHAQKLLTRNGAEAKEIVEIYRKEIDATQEQIKKFNDLNVEDRDKYIRELEEKIWDMEDSIKEALASVHEAEINAFENSMYLLEQKYKSAVDRRDYDYMRESLQKQLDIQKEVMTTAHAEAQRLRELGVEENDDAIQECIRQYWNARQKVRDINKLIEQDIMGAYSDFLSFADSLNLWDYFDFTKVDYIRNQLEDINRLMREGYITAEEYISLSKQWSIDYYAAAKEALEATLEAEKEAAQTRHNETVARFEEQKEELEREKERIEDYYKALKEGYELEIESWEKRKDSSDDYYDSLIANLRDVQESNDRINRQIDYYNNRSKIITNIEQAQARSGVEWRQKEIEYQQQLVELDENWNRTLNDWNIQDQISHLQELKELAAKDIEETIKKIREEIDAMDAASEAAIRDIENRNAAIDDLIQNAEEELERELESIGNQMDELSRRIAESIQNTIQNGIVNTQEEMDAAILATQNTMLASNDIIQARVLESIGYSTSEALNIINNELLNPVQQKINALANGFWESLNSSTLPNGVGFVDADNMYDGMLNSTSGTFGNFQNQASSSGGRTVVRENGMDWIIQPHEGPMGNSGTTNIFVSNDYASAADGARGTQETIQWIIM